MPVMRAAPSGRRMFPGVRPRLISYDFPVDLVDSTRVSERIDATMSMLNASHGECSRISYRASVDVGQRRRDRITRSHLLVCSPEGRC